MLKYYIYDNSAQGYSKLHKWDCIHALPNAQRYGVHSIGGGDQWFGPYSKTEAKARMEALGRDRSPCGVCKP